MLVIMVVVVVAVVGFFFIANGKQITQIYIIQFAVVRTT